MPGPSRLAESIVAFVVPPACREEILGDLYERYQSPASYFVHAIRVVPFVILSRIRRTSSIQMTLMEAVSTYAGFLGASIMTNAGTDPGMLAIPAMISIATTRVEDAYAKPGQRSAYALSRGPAIGLALAIAAMWLRLPHNLLLIGSGLALTVVTGVRVLFAPAPGQLRGIHAPASWLKPEPVEPLARTYYAGIALCLLIAVVLKLLTRR